MTPDQDPAGSRGILDRMALACRDIIARGVPREQALARATAGIGRHSEASRIRGTIQGVLKHRILLDFIVASARGRNTNDQGDVEYFVDLIVTYLAFKEGIDRGRLAARKDAVEGIAGPNRKGLVDSIAQLDINRLLDRLDEADQLAIRTSNPPFLVKRLLQFLPRDRIEKLMRAEENSANFWINCRDAGALHRAEALLSSKQFVYIRDPSILGLLQVRNRPGYKREVLESLGDQQQGVLFQDLASALVVNVLDPRPGDLVIDACAAPFQKTIGIAWRVQPTGRVIASEASRARIAENRRDLGRAHSCASLVQADATTLHHFFRGMQPSHILVDAPCTGSGSLGAYPELATLQNPEVLERHATIQAGLLDSVIESCRSNEWPDTAIVYSTCSYYPEEGEAQIEDILDRIDIEDLHDTESHPRHAARFSTGWAGFTCARKVIRTFPDVDGGAKGFFIARFKVRCE